MTPLEKQLEDAKGSKPAAVGPPAAAPAAAPPAAAPGAAAPAASTRIDAKKPTMGGLVDGHHRKEAWVGGKPNFRWTELENPNAINFPQPTQMRSSSAKAATTHPKRTKGMFTKEACRFLTGEDLDDLCASLVNVPLVHFRWVVAAFALLDRI